MLWFYCGSAVGLVGANIIMNCVLAKYFGIYDVKSKKFA